jgi:hypothetical protein
MVKLICTQLRHDNNHHMWRGILNVGFRTQTQNTVLYVLGINLEQRHLFMPVCGPKAGQGGYLVKNPECHQMNIQLRT